MIQKFIIGDYHTRLFNKGEIMNKKYRVYRSINLLRKDFQPAVKAMQSVIRIYNLPFRVFETWRCYERQAFLEGKGVSWTTTGKHPKRMAVDIVHYDNKTKKKWSWVFNDSYIILAFLIKFHVVRKFPHLKIKWGGDWKKKHFDPYHWQMTLK